MSDEWQQRWHPAAASPAMDIVPATGGRTGGAAIAGYGAAMGRDAWRTTKKNRELLLLFALAACAVVILIFGGGVLGLLVARILAGQVTFDEFLFVAGIDVAFEPFPYGAIDGVIHCCFALWHSVR